MAQTRKLRKSQLLFSKVGKCKQITKMFITPVLTMLTQTFWALFAALGCPHKIKKISSLFSQLTEKLEKEDLKSLFSVFYVAN